MIIIVNIEFVFILIFFGEFWVIFLCYVPSRFFSRLWRTSRSNRLWTPTEISKKDLKRDNIFCSFSVFFPSSQITANCLRYSSWFLTTELGTWPIWVKSFSLKLEVIFLSGINPVTTINPAMSVATWFPLKKIADISGVIISRLNQRSRQDRHSVGYTSRFLKQLHQYRITWPSKCQWWWSLHIWTKRK